MKHKKRKEKKRKISKNQNEKTINNPHFTDEVYFIWPPLLYTLRPAQTSVISLQGNFCDGILWMENP